MMVINTRVYLPILGMYKHDLSHYPGARWAPGALLVTCPLDNDIGLSYH